MYIMYNVQFKLTFSKNEENLATDNDVMHNCVWSVYLPCCEPKLVPVTHCTLLPVWHMLPTSLYLVLLVSA